jgi:hypothetical protein
MTYRSPNVDWITVEQVRREDFHEYPKAIKRKKLSRRPASGPVCEVCGCILYSYEKSWRKCLYHKRAGIILAREGSTE